MDKSKEPQIYRVENELWIRLSKALPIPEGRGRRPTDDKGCFEGIIYVMRTGCQWKELPKCYPPKSTVHDRLQNWRKSGVFINLWMELLIEYDDLLGLDWEWLSGDTSFVKSPLGGEKKQGLTQQTEVSWEQREGLSVKGKEYQLA
jgi:putative transposase